MIHPGAATAWVLGFALVLVAQVATDGTVALALYAAGAVLAGIGVVLGQRHRRRDRDRAGDDGDR